MGEPTSQRRERRHDEARNDAALLAALRLLSPQDVLTGVGAGADVYLFLIGMMLLAEIERVEGLFDWLATIAAKRTNRSASRVFLLIYVVGTIVTAFLSNHATAVRLTPAVAAIVRAAKAEAPTLLVDLPVVANAG